MPPAASPSVVLREKQNWLIHMQYTRQECVPRHDNEYSTFRPIIPFVIPLVNNPDLTHRVLPWTVGMMHASKPSSSS